MNWWVAFGVVIWVFFQWDTVPYGVPETRQEQVWNVLAAAAFAVVIAAALGRGLA